MDSGVTAALQRVAQEINAIRAENTGAAQIAKIDVELGHSDWQLAPIAGATYGATTTVPVEII